MMTRVLTMTRFTSLALTAGVLLLAGCSEHQDPMDPETMGDVVEIEIRNFEFSPSSVQISPGTTIRWRNNTGNYHTVTPDGHTAWTEWQTAGMGETFEVTFGLAGTYDYFCTPHRALGMTGSIIVQ